MQEKKAQHYVPQTYLKRFAVMKKDQFFLHRLCTPEFKETDIKSINIKNLCVQNRLYTLPGTTIQEKMLVEDFYSDVYERHYDGVYKKLIDETVSKITDEDRRVIIGMVVSLFYRNPFWHDFHNKIMADMFERAFRLSKENGKDYFIWNDEEISIKGKTVDDLKREYKQDTHPTLVITQARAAIKLLKLRLDYDGISITKVKSPGYEYLTSDRPVNIMDTNGRHIIPMNPLNFFTLPIDSKHKLSLLPECHSENRYKIMRFVTDGNMETFSHNVQLASKADRFIMGSEAGLKNFAEIIEKMPK